MRHRNAFTLVELLVVVAIIVALLAILMPSMGKAYSLARTAVCLSQQRQIDTGIKSYLAGSFGKYHPRRNWGRWFDNITTQTPIDPGHANAYWGVAYADTVGRQGARPLFNCPEAMTSDMNTGSSNPGLGYTDGTFEAGHVFNTYGFNGLAPAYAATAGATQPAPFHEYPAATTGNGPGRNFAQVQQPSSIILFQDAFEHMLDGNGDMPWSFTQWNTTQNREYFRHNLDTDGNVLWADGHATSEKAKVGWTVWRYSAY